MAASQLPFARDASAQAVSTLRAGITGYKYIDWFRDHPIADDLKLYEAFGQEIERRFNRPVAEIAGRRGAVVEINFLRN